MTMSLHQARAARAKTARSPHVRERAILDGRRETMAASVPSDKRLVLFDGTCNFCNGAVLFIIDRDPREAFLFAPLESELGQNVLAAHPELDPNLDSIVLVDGDKVHIHSGAALRIGTKLSGIWPLFAWLGFLLPAFVRDAAYKAFARRRYRWFGRSESCRVPTPELRRRFLSLSKT
jgi:predicted DCC family thiol-disulfide oxidoreductase YuxK